MLGTAYNFFESGPAVIPIVFVSVILFQIALLFTKYEGRHICFFLQNLLIFLLFLQLSFADNNLRFTVTQISRINAGAGFYIMAILLYLPFFERTDKNKIDAFLRMLPIFLFLTFLLLGLFDNFGPLKEFYARKTRFYSEVLTHINLSITALSIAFFIAVPIAFLSYKNDLFENIITPVINVIQTIPSLALFGLMIGPLAWISHNIPTLRALGIQGVGNTPAIIALTAYAILPLFRNTFAALKNLPKKTILAAKGMGMTPLQIFLKIELPLAFPVILGGIRIALVQTIGNTTIAALVGAGGLGNFVFQGLGQSAPDLILLGALPILMLTLLSHKILKLLGYLFPYTMEKEI